MATSIFFLGRTIRTPGSYSQVDASGLEQPGLGAAGIVAVIGDGEGGQPAGTMTKPSEFIKLNTPEQVRDVFRSGDLREAAAMLFEPSSDPNILGGAAQVIAMKTNNATQSTATLSNVDGDAIDLTSEDYGQFTEQINVTLADATGTLTGFLLTIGFEDDLETVDGLGGDDIATLAYTTSVRTWDTITVDVQAGGGIQTTGTFDIGGLLGDVVLAWSSGTADVTAAAADAGTVATIYGTIAGGALVTEDITLINGSATSTTTFLDVLGVILDADVVDAGGVTVEQTSGGADRFVVPQGSRSQGMLDARAFYVDDTTFTVTSDDGTATENIYVWGRTSSGANARETLTLVAGTATSTITPRQIDAVSLADLPGADTLTIAGTVATSDPTIQTDLQKTKDFFDSRNQLDNDDTTVVGFSWTNLTGLTTRAVTELDEQTGLIAGNHPTTGLSAGIRADMWDVINWINNNSTLITAAKAAGATNKPPTNTGGPLYLAGGVEGATAVADFQNALNLLKQTRVNSIIVLSGNSATHSALEAHCAFMGGIGRNERDGLVGIVKVDGSGVPTADPPVLATKQEYLDQIVALNSRHLRAAGQFIDRFNTAGDRTTFQPWAAACIAAGMQNGSPIGTSLTHKFANVLDVEQDSSWNPTDDSEEMIDGGALVLEPVEGVGIRWVRNITTFLQSDNIAFTEASVNEAVNFATFTLRTNLEAAVGQRGTPNTLNGVKGIARNTLGLLVDEGIIVQYRGLTLELNVDVLDVSVEIAPVIPINFVRTVIHLVTLQQQV